MFPDDEIIIEAYRETTANDLPDGVLAQASFRENGEIHIVVAGDNPAAQAHVLGHMRAAVTAEIQALGRMAAEGN